MTADEIGAVAIKYGIPVLTFFGGYYIGHWYALKRDRRKEWNAIAEPLLETIEAEIKSPSPLRGIDGKELGKIRRRLWFWGRWRLDRAVAKYKDAKKKNLSRDELGGLIYNDSDLTCKATTPIKKAARELTKAIRLR